jgi:ligand-binding sensor domain-containing protein
MKKKSGSQNAEIGHTFRRRDSILNGRKGLPPRVAGRSVAVRRLILGGITMLLGLPLAANLTAQPVIDQQPLDRIVAMGGDATFQVSATGTEPLSYQWRFNDINLEGETQYFLRITNAQPNRAGAYTVLVTDANGSTISEPANLTLDRAWILYKKANSGLPYNDVVDLEVDRDGNVWIATGLWNGFGGGGLAKFNGRQWTVYQSGRAPLPSNDGTGLTQDAAGNLWIATEGGVFRFDRTSQWKVVTGSQTWFPRFDLEGKLWVGTSSGLLTYDGAKWTRYQRANSGLPNDFVAYISVDAQNRKWISTHGGLALFDNVNWTVYTRSNSGLPNDTVAPITFDDQGFAWIGTYGGGLARFDGAQWTLYKTANSGLPNMYIEDVLIDAKGVKWIATDGGLARFDGANWTTYNRSNSRLPDNVVQTLVFDRYGNLWLGMKDGGLAAFREGGVIPRVQIDSLVGDGQGSLVLRWTGGQGPYQVQGRPSLITGEWENYGVPTNQQSLAVGVEGPSRFFRVKETQF